MALKFQNLFFLKLKFQNHYGAIPISSELVAVLVENSASVVSVPRWTVVAGGACRRTLLLQSSEQGQFDAVAQLPWAGW